LRQFRKATRPLPIELLQAGVPMDRVSVILGHSSIKVTEKHYSPWVRARQESLRQM
jgi:integrase/recombinase XerD